MKEGVISLSYSILSVVTYSPVLTQRIYLAQQSCAGDHHSSPNRCEPGSDMSCLAGPEAASPAPESCPGMGR